MWALLVPGIGGFGCLDTNTTDEKGQESNKRRMPAPTFSLLGHALFQCSLSFFLFSFQVHEKSILVPLLPITVLMAASAPTVEGGDWEWGVLLNNVACFRRVIACLLVLFVANARYSMWPLLKRDGLGVQYVALVLLWNYVIGHNPLRQSALKYLTSVRCSCIVYTNGTDLPLSSSMPQSGCFISLNWYMHHQRGTQTSFRCSMPFYAPVYSVLLTYGVSSV